ncbi:MAG TPA: LysM peptidoglycan-binding domain-containing protein, partial [Anaerolineales bacterium]|nr:LysM peptidoglycan-binding domain-containing protein [Anaerolineales bacterium]
TRQAVEYQLVVLDLDVKMRDAQDYIRAGRAEPALALLDEIEAVDADYPELESTRTEAVKLQALDEQYAEAMALIDAGELTAALVVLEDIEGQQPYYRDVKNRILTIQDQTLLGDQLREADGYFANEQWEEAAESYYSMYSLNPDYQTAHVEDRLFSSYVNAAETLLNSSDTIEGIKKVEDYFQRALALRPQEPEVKDKQARVRSMIEERLFRSYVFLAQSAIVDGTNTLEALKIADRYFTEALRLKPNDPEITMQRELAHQFVLGQDNLLKSAYGDAIANMEIVLGEDPGYAKGAARQTLYEAYVARGDSAMAIGDFDSALEDFQRAAVIANEDPSSKGRLYEIQMRIAEAQGLLGDYDPAVRLYQSAIEMADLRARANQYSSAMAEALSTAEEYAAQGNMREAFRYYREAATWANQVFDVVVHVVTSDDYLSQLALDYNSTVNLIATANNLANPNIIIPGQELLIPILP